MPTELDDAIVRFTRALLEDCPPIELHELGVNRPALRGNLRPRRTLAVGIVLTAAAAAAVVGLIVVARGHRESRTVVVGTTPDTVLPSTTASPLPSALTPAFTGPLGLDDHGAEVSVVQQRLADLHFDPGPVDGYFGQATQAAVWAYQKAVLGLPPGQATGVITPDTWASLQTDTTAAPRRSGIDGVHLEVDLVSQVLAVFRDDQPILITHISSGDGRSWTESVTLDPDTVDNPGSEPVTKTVSGTGITPAGVYAVTRTYELGDGWRTDSLGRMYRPVYFNVGIAIHGAANVPNQPSSHGAIKIPMHIAEYLPQLVTTGEPVYVFDGVHDPEYYGAQPPPFHTEVLSTVPETTPPTT